MEEIEKRLESPDCKKNIQLVTPQILQANLYAKKMLKSEIDNFARTVDENFCSNCCRRT